MALTATLTATWANDSNRRWTNQPDWGRFSFVYGRWWTPADWADRTSEPRVGGSNPSERATNLDSESACSEPVGSCVTLTSL